MARKVIGRQMRRAVEIVRNNPGCTKMFVAQRITRCPVPSSNWAYGYSPVDRAIKAGLLRATMGRTRNSYSLQVSA